MKDLQKITSRENSKLKTARRVRDGKEPRSAFIEGVRLAEEAMRSDLAVSLALVSESAVGKPAVFGLVERLVSKGVSPIIVRDDLLASLSETAAPQGIILLAERPAAEPSALYKLLNFDGPGLPLTIYLNEINNPSNLGAVLRTAEAAGARGVITSTNSADAYASKALRSSMGSAFRIPVLQNAMPEEVIAAAREKKIKSVAADINAQKPYTQVDWTQPHLLIFGSEAHGLGDQERELVDELIFIPMAPPVESLNLAVSCGIILFEARRQFGR